MTDLKDLLPKQAIWEAQKQPFCTSELPQGFRNFQQSVTEGEAEKWALVMHLFEDQVKSQYFNSMMLRFSILPSFLLPHNTYSKFECSGSTAGRSEEFQTSDTGMAVELKTIFWWQQWALAWVRRLFPKLHHVVCK